MAALHINTKSSDRPKSCPRLLPFRSCWASPRHGHAHPRYLPLARRLLACLGSLPFLPPSSTDGLLGKSGAGIGVWCTNAGFSITEWTAVADGGTGHGHGRYGVPGVGMPTKKSRTRWKDGKRARVRRDCRVILRVCIQRNGTRWGKPWWFAQSFNVKGKQEWMLHVE